MFPSTEKQEIFLSSVPNFTLFSRYFVESSSFIQRFNIRFMIHFDGKIPLIRSQMLQTILFKNVEKQISTKQTYAIQ